MTENIQKPTKNANVWSSNLGQSAILGERGRGKFRNKSP